MTGSVMRVRGIKRYKHPKTGITYIYHRASSKRIHAEFGTAEFFLELQKLNAEWKAKQDGKAAASKSTVTALFTFYRQSAKFAALKPRVKEGYEEAITYLLDRIGSMSFKEITPGFVAQLRDKVQSKRSWHFANEVRKVLSVAFNVACEAGLADRNPVRETKKAKRPKDAPRANRPWTYEERVAVMRAAPNHLKLPVALGMYMGWREGDVLSMPKTARRGLLFSFTTGKTGEYAEMPIPRPLIAILKECTGHNAITLCASSKGKPWTQNGFSSSFWKFLKQLEAEGQIGPGLTFHGLRHTAATVLKEVGASDDEIAAWLTHSPQMARHYSRDASKLQARKAIVNRFDPLQRRLRRTI